MLGLGLAPPPRLPASRQVAYLPPSPSFRPLPGQMEPDLLHGSAEGHATMNFSQGEKFGLEGSNSMLPVCSSRIKLRGLPWWRSG